MLPLFPLNAVLFPGCTLDLQLFEARYLDMIGRCMKKGEGFGVVCILDHEYVAQAPDGYALIGCEALVRDFQQQENGLLGIRVEGARRFRVVSSDVQRDQLIVAQVEWLDELQDHPLQERDADLMALLSALAEHPMVAALNMGVTAIGQQSLANQLAYLLPFTEEDKVELLELSDAQQRLNAIQDLLDEMQGDLHV
ncbi:LON peptidase substrate-binding domain-containing protein [Pseudomonas sp. CCC3.2]|uniref:LON peptidase substrate-binding domain-containing protein n=1 Tax=unclassified Pseudomonas TaxID=196821 RepID=UPI002AB4ADEF|nr:MULTISPECIES: LON peptidase substrate-binding domain-containing protein [unclassified Pseudomonas]MDY7562023.1 LON peptidase substrate-binding domain-containing protein [Pseudomonas sp. AB6]MEB0179774.1 LON peptidase substrate-binding domain-containing protein [Pseudomonas sp. CCC3.2]MEB0209546.1 LON peptidase substrate-binding domain-containing protein [Pseudomonas sp. AB6]